MPCYPINYAQGIYRVTHSTAVWPEQRGRARGGGIYTYIYIYIYAVIQAYKRFFVTRVPRVMG
jgi:hypothetical protein